MNKIDGAISTIKHIDDLNGRDQWMNKIHPLVKLFVVVLAIAFTMATHKYDIVRMIMLGAIPLVLLIISDLPFRDAIKRTKFVLPIVGVLGLVNLFMDKADFMIGGITVRAGLVSMIVLILKGTYAVFLAYFLVGTTSIEKLCMALRKLHIPKLLVIQIMLTYRYISLLLGEVERIVTAYSLRAPGQRGIHFRVWGSLAGQFLLRSFDKAEQVYESMQLRGFDGEFRDL